MDLVNIRGGNIMKGLFNGFGDNYWIWIILLFCLFNDDILGDFDDILPWLVVLFCCFND